MMECEVIYMTVTPTVGGTPRSGTESTQLGSFLDFTECNRKYEFST